MSNCRQKKKQRTDGMKRGRQEHQKDEKIITDKTDEDTKERRKDLEQEICVITWNVNTSSAQYDFLRDMAQCQADMVMFQETQNWQENGTARELCGLAIPLEPLAHAVVSQVLLSVHMAAWRGKNHQWMSIFCTLRVHPPASPSSGTCAPLAAGIAEGVITLVPAQYYRCDVSPCQVRRGLQERDRKKGLISQIKLAMEQDELNVTHKPDIQSLHGTRRPVSLKTEVEKSSCEQQYDR